MSKTNKKESSFKLPVEIVEAVVVTGGTAVVAKSDDD